MSGKFSVGLYLFSLWFFGPMVAQDPEILNFGEEELLYSEESATFTSDLLERYADLQSNPLPINCATPDELAESGLLSPFQIHILMQYRSRYGDLYSIYELASLTGFKTSRLQEIAPYLSVGPCSKGAEKGLSKHLILLNAGRVFSEVDSSYPGCPYRTDLRIKSQWGNSLSLGFTYEKDAGERFFLNHKPEYLAAYLQYRGHRNLKQVILGNYQLHQGLGLVNGTGFIHSMSGYLLNSASMMSIKPYSSKGESRYERGMGLRMGLGRIQLLSWFSHRKMDLSLSNLKVQQSEVDWWELFRTSGTHRTESECSGRDLAFRIHSGIQGIYAHKRLKVGLLVGLESAGLSKEGMDVPGIEGNRGWRSYGSLHGTLNAGKWMVFGELALSRRKATALLAGLTWKSNDFIQGVLLLHRYDTEYRGVFPASYAFGSQMNNEMGVSLYLRLEPGPRILAHLSGEVFHFPGPRYLCAVPSSGYRYAISFQNSGTPLFGWSVKFSQKFSQFTPASSGAGLRTIQAREIARGDLRLIYNGPFQWQSRLIVTSGTNIREVYPGYALAQQLALQAGKFLKPTFQFVVFEVRDWSQRIYLHEPGLYYDFSFPVCYGSGQKLVLTLTLKPFQKWTIAGKMALTTYYRQYTHNPGNDLIHGKEKWNLSLQIRANL